MGWAHEGAVISLTARTTTWTRSAGLGGSGLESATACWINEVPGPTGAALGPNSGVFGPAAAVIGPGSAVPGSAKTLVPSAGALESDLTSSGGAGTKMESDSGEGLIDGLRRR